MQIDKHEKFVPGKTRIKYGGAFTDQDDFDAIQSVLDRNWWTIDPNGHGGQLENELADFAGIDYATLTNSGSSALTVAFDALSFPKDSEIITGAVQFPTAISAIVKNNLVPVFVDVDVNNLSVDLDLIENAITPKTKAILAVAIAGNIPDIDKLTAIADKHNLKLVLDNCDGFGGTWDDNSLEYYFDISATSFHAAHIMCMGEGGAVFSRDHEIGKKAQSLREWGRMGDTDDSTKFEGIPDDYPGRYIFKHIGYNVKPLELQCALGRTQLKKLPKIKELRQRNFTILHKGLKTVENIVLPEVLSKASPSWFSFPMIVERRAELREFLEARNIETRTIFGGNITRQPAFKDIGYIKGNLDISDKVMEQGMFVSVHPSATPEMMEYIVDSIKEFYA